MQSRAEVGKNKASATNRLLGTQVGGAASPFSRGGATNFAEIQAFSNKSTFLLGDPVKAKSNISILAVRVLGVDAVVVGGDVVGCWGVSSVAAKKNFSTLPIIDGTKHNVSFKTPLVTPDSMLRQNTSRTRQAINTSRAPAASAHLTGLFLVAALPAGCLGHFLDGILDVLTLLVEVVLEPVRGNVVV